MDALLRGNRSFLWGYLPCDDTGAGELRGNRLMNFSRCIGDILVLLRFKNHALRAESGGCRGCVIMVLGFG